MATAGFFPAADAWFGTTPMPYYPGATVAGFTPNQQASWQTGMDAYANAMPQAQNMAQWAEQAQNAYANFDPFNNPALNQMATDYRNQMNQQYDRFTAPQTQYSAQAAGQMGSSRHGIAEGLARSDLNNTISQGLNTLYGNAYQQGLNNQTSMLQNQAGFLNQLQNSYMAPYNMQRGLSQYQMDVGSQQQAMNQANIGAEMDRYNYYQNLPYDQLSKYGALLGLINTGNTSTAPNPEYQDPWAGALGGMTLYNALF